VSLLYVQLLLLIIIYFWLHWSTSDRVSSIFSNGWITDFFHFIYRLNPLNVWFFYFLHCALGILLTHGRHLPPKKEKEKAQFPSKMNSKTYVPVLNVTNHLLKYKYCVQINFIFEKLCPELITSIFFYDLICLHSKFFSIKCMVKNAFPFVSVEKIIWMEM